MAPRRLLAITRIVHESDRTLLYGLQQVQLAERVVFFGSEDFYVIARPRDGMDIHVGMTIMYEPYGVNFGWWCPQPCSTTPRPCTVPGARKP